MAALKGSNTSTKTTLGRQKIQIKKLVNKSSLQVTFSKCQETLEKLEVEKKRIKEIEKENEEKGKVDPIDDNMGIEELEAYAKAMEELRNSVASMANELMGDIFTAAAATSFSVQNGGFVVGESSGYGDFGLDIECFNFGHGPDLDC
ncbi:hypothetical protein F3Y22_tig00110831pilonHSYRG00171 [Hibiscus syriacus]|uniref:MADS-box domain-containing protein n=1 Tax=Hibiscus syriacus TaxID=106335 RepID=A0A6A2ZKV7_HIBSY|nr:hypothetical protein F3Y22_tig00110831pilonHSYRG00171 [Hibiscus syriacus]